MSEIGLHVPRKKEPNASYLLHHVVFNVEIMSTTVNLAA